MSATMSRRAWNSMLLAVATGACLALADGGYVASIAEHRQSVDAEFRDPATSPIPEADIPAFPGLDYFPVKPALRMVARFEPASNTTAFRMPTFSGGFIDFSQYGYLAYRPESGTEVRLTLFQREDIGAVGKTFALLPFRDLSNGEATYSGGRYIEIALPLSDPPIVDFNLSFNPYCAYDSNFACPIPPKENWLDTPVPAGEKAYHRD